MEKCTSSQWDSLNLSTLISTISKLATVEKWNSIKLYLTQATLVFRSLIDMKTKFWKVSKQKIIIVLSKSNSMYQCSHFWSAVLKTSMSSLLWFWTLEVSSTESKRSSIFKDACRTQNRNVKIPMRITVTPTLSQWTMRAREIWYS